MSKIYVETSGLFRYEVSGDNAEQAAAELSARIDAAERMQRNGSFLLDDLSAIRQSVSEKHGVATHVVV